MVGFYEHGDKSLNSQKQINMTMKCWRKSLNNGQVDNFIHYCSIFYYIYQVVYTHACTHTWVHPCMCACTHENTHTHSCLIILHKICNLQKVNYILIINASTTDNYSSCSISMLMKLLQAYTVLTFIRWIFSAITP